MVQFTWFLWSLLIFSQTVKSLPTTNNVAILQEGNNGVFDKCINSGTIAFTFDDGPSAFTEEVLNALKEKDVKATFFVNGVNQLPIMDSFSIVQRMCKEGHEIASHTWHHADLTAVPEETIFKEMLDLEEAVEGMMIGYKMVTMRPPYGNYNEEVINIVHKELNYSIVMWNLDTNDWRNKEDIEKSMEYYRQAMESTSSQESSFISLHHDFVVGSGDLTRQAIDYALSKGYTPVTVRECLGLPEEVENSVCGVDGGGTTEGNGSRVINIPFLYKILSFSLLVVTFWKNKIVN